MPPRQSWDTSQDESLFIRDIIFSCGVCQATLSEIYATKEHNKGFHSCSGDGDGLINRFCISACCHTFCTKHLDGGGLPFHSQKAPPRAACPVCVLKGRGNNEQDLFAIRGLSPGQYDDALPRDFMECPPLDFGGDDVKFNAMRFQYHQLCHYSRAVNKHWKSTERKRHTMENALSQERKDRRAAETNLKNRIAALEKAEARLRKWEQRRDMIHHYLGLVNKMAQDITILRTKLTELGCAVPDQNYAFEPTIADTKRSSSSRKRKHPIEDQYMDPAYEDTYLQVQPQQALEVAPKSSPFRSKPQSYAFDAQSTSDLDAWVQPRSRQNVQGTLGHAPFAELNSSITVQTSQRLQPVYQCKPLGPGKGQNPSPVYQELPTRERDLYGTCHKHEVPPFMPPQRTEQAAVTNEQQYGSYTGAEQPYLAENGSIFLQSDLLSMPIRRRNGQNLYAKTVEICEEQPPLSQARKQTSSRIMHCKPAYDSQADQSDDQAPRRLRSSRSPSPQNRSIAQWDATRRFGHRTHFQHRTAEPVSDFMASPYFRRPPLPLHSDNAAQTQARRTVLPQQISSSKECAHVFRTAESPTARSLQPIRLADRTGMVPVHTSQTQQSLGAHRPLHMSNTALSHELARTMPTPPSQQPWASQQFHPSPQVYRPYSDTNRSRMTLPPSKSKTPLRSSRVPGLAMIQGVKCGSASNTRESRHGYTPTYATSR